jgi:hypothetical protein
LDSYRRIERGFSAALHPGEVWMSSLYIKCPVIESIFGALEICSVVHEITAVSIDNRVGEFGSVWARHGCDWGNVSQKYPLEYIRVQAYSNYGSRKYNIAARMHLMQAYQTRRSEWICKVNSPNSE